VETAARVPVAVFLFSADMVSVLSRLIYYSRVFLRIITYFCSLEMVFGNLVIGYFDE